jgi:hypothetical protein
LQISFLLQIYLYTGGLGLLVLINGPTLLTSIVEVLVQDKASYSEILGNQRRDTLSFFE